MLRSRHSRIQAVGSNRANCNSTHEVTNESTHFCEHGGCGRGKHSHPRRERRCTAGADCPKRRPGARIVRRRVVLVGGDRTLAGSRPQCHRGAKPADNAARSGSLGRARARAARWSDGSGRAFLLRNDRDRGRHASEERVGSCLCGGASSGCGRGLHSVGQDISDATRVRRDCVRQR